MSRVRYRAAAKLCREPAFVLTGLVDPDHFCRACPAFAGANRAPTLQSLAR